MPELAEFGNTKYRQLIKKSFRLIYLVREGKDESVTTVAILLRADGRRNFSTLLQQRLFRV